MVIPDPRKMPKWCSWIRYPLKSSLREKVRSRRKMQSLNLNSN
jgi:hypothetical protein